MKEQAALRLLFERYHKEHHFGGVALIKSENELVFQCAYGWAHRGFQVPNTLETMFDTASITKLFTAVAILQLVDQGRLKLSDCITGVVDLSGTKIPSDVTIHHLLTHTSGIADDADEEMGESYEALFVDKPSYSVRNCEDFIPLFAYKEPKFKAGTDVSYNNCAFVLLGLAIEKITAISYREYVKEHVFEVCGMTRTGFIAKDEADFAIAEGYDALYDSENEVVWRKNIYAFPPIGTADGGAFTTVGDLDLFMRALANGKLLSPAMTAEMMKPQTLLKREYDWGAIINGYAFHFVYDQAGKLVRMYKDGSNYGVVAMLAYYPDQQTTSIILGNHACDIWKLHDEAERLLFVRE